MKLGYDILNLVTISRLLLVLKLVDNGGRQRTGNLVIWWWICIKDFGNWSRNSDAYETYIHTVPATASGQRFFGWMKPDWALAHPADAALVFPELL